METTKTNYPDEIVSAGQLLRILDSDAREISALCQRACLRPKKDGFGNIYFSKGDVDVLRKVKELYEHTKRLQDEKRTSGSKTPLKENKLKKLKEENLLRSEMKETKQDSDMADNYMSRNSLPVRADMSKTEPLSHSQQSLVMRKIESVENNVISKITDLLSEKLDGLDEVIVELIKAKTENENLRQKVNELNKENFALKTENSSYKSVGLGFYIKKSTDEFNF